MVVFLTSYAVLKALIHLLNFQFSRISQFALRITPRHLSIRVKPELIYDYSIDKINTDICGIIVLFTPILCSKCRRKQTNDMIGSSSHGLPVIRTHTHMIRLISFQYVTREAIEEETICQRENITEELRDFDIGMALKINRRKISHIDSPLVLFFCSTHWDTKIKTLDRISRYLVIIQTRRRENQFLYFVLHPHNMHIILIDILCQRGYRQFFFIRILPQLCFHLFESIIKINIRNITYSMLYLTIREHECMYKHY